jgi:hypothetical protein
MNNQAAGGAMAPSGTLGMTITKDLGVLRNRTDVKWKFKNWITKRWKEDLAFGARQFLGKITTSVRFESRLYLKIVRGDGTIVDLGLVGRKVVTTVGVGYIVDAFQNLVELEDMKYHGFGTGSTAENVSDSTLVTELTTEYAGNVRPTGTTTEGASANIYRTVATLTPDSGGSIALREHGVFSANAAGVLLDRTVFAAVTLDSANGDSLQATYELTLTAGS